LDSVKNGGITVWSGARGFNTPINTFRETIKTGVVFNARHLIVPQADFYAAVSEGCVEGETIKQTSKYPNKPVHTRNHGVITCTNQARYEKLPQEPSGKKVGVKHETGTAAVFAKNVWRKYFKPSKNRENKPSFKGAIKKDNIMGLNEAIVFQSSEINPINGLLLTGGIDSVTRRPFANIMKEHSKLNLYFYDMRAGAHIMRYLDNAKARDFLMSEQLFEQAFTTAKPYMGIPDTYEPLSKLLSRYKGCCQKKYDAIQDVLKVLHSPSIDQSVLSSLKKCRAVLNESRGIYGWFSAKCRGFSTGTSTNSQANTTGAEAVDIILSQFR